MSDESKPETTSAANSQPEPVSANRRAFMKTVFTGTVAAGMVASVGQAEAATPAAACATPERLPSSPTSVKVLFNKNLPPTLDRIRDILAGTFGQTGCPNCGLGGYPNNPNPVVNVSLEMAHMREDIDSLVIVQDAPFLGK